MMDIVISMGLTGAMLAMLGMGLLISYYGSSKTRNVGLLFLVIGIGLAYYITSIDDSNVHFGNAFIESFSMSQSKNEFLSSKYSYSCSNINAQQLVLTEQEQLQDCVKQLVEQQPQLQAIETELNNKQSEF